MAEYIEREAAIKVFRDKYGAIWSQDALFAIFMTLNDVPAADVAPVVRGKWERHYTRPNVYADLFWHCSACGYKHTFEYSKYCPNCGAQMKDGDGE